MGTTLILAQMENAPAHPRLYTSKIMHPLWKSFLFTSIAIFSLLLSNDALSLKVQYDGIYIIPVSSNDLKLSNNTSYIRQNWLLYAISGKIIPEYRNSAYQSIRNFAKNNSLNIKWDNKSSTIILHSINPSPLSSSIKDAYNLIFYPINSPKSIPSDFTWILSDNKLNIYFTSHLKIEGIIAKSDGTFSAFGNNIRSPMKLPNECSSTFNKTTCQFELPNSSVYIALRFI